jgi:hypothetical protein
MSMVIVPSLRYKLDPTSGQHVPVADISPAKEFGNIVFLTTPGNRYVNQLVIDEIVSKMEDIGPDDVIMMTGDMILFAIAAGEMAGYFGYFNTLRWYSRENRYIKEKWDWDLSDFADDTPEVAAPVHDKLEAPKKIADFQELLDKMEDDDEIELKDQYKAA